MKTPIIVKLFLLIVALSLYTCKKKEDAPQQEQAPQNMLYPVKIGNEWQYERTLILKNYDSLVNGNLLSIDTLISHWIVKIDGIQVIGNGVETYKFSCKYVEGNLYSYNYCTHDNNHFLIHAYVNHTGTSASPKSMYNPYDDMDLFGLSSASKTLGDSLVYENPVTTILSYPLEVNKEWLFRSNKDVYITKKVLSKEDITLNGTTYNCFKIAYLNTAAQNFYDYVSEQGLIKREIAFNRVPQLDNIGEPNGIYSEGKEVFLLKNINLQ